MTKKFAVLGKPISHSKSPVIHKTILSSLGVDASYEAIELGDDLSEFLDAHSDFSGFSITMPLKDQAFANSTELDANAQASRSVNTLLKVAGGWSGYNTDPFGIHMALKKADLSSVLILGTGATARSAIVAVRNLTSDLRVWGRNHTSALALASEYGVRAAESLVEAGTCSTVVSTLPALALDGLLDQIRDPHGTLLDVAYYPWPSKAANHWTKSGNAVSGLEMLIWQAVMQQRIFSGDGPTSPLPNEEALVDAVRLALSVTQ